MERVGNTISLIKKECAVRVPTVTYSILGISFWLTRRE
ncbi:hypothetical protein DyAD56_01080 [Dyella sp. AD56]|nr:hypothetical protein DyAD56_01080 [Dyella sp. AD56]